MPRIYPISPPAQYVAQHSLTIPSPPPPLPSPQPHRLGSPLSPSHPYEKKTKLTPSFPLPQQSPALSAIGSTGCQANDFACLCKDNSFINAALAGAEKQCSQADLQSVYCPRLITFPPQPHLRGPETTYRRDDRYGNKAVRKLPDVTID